MNFKLTLVMEYITTTVNNFRHFIEPESLEKLVKEFEETKSIHSIMSFEKFVLTRLKALQSRFEDCLTEVCLPMSKQDIETRLKNLNIELNHLIELSKTVTICDAALFQKYFYGFKAYFNKKYVLSFPESTDIVTPHIKKITWLGNLNTLTTFLIELHNGKNTVGRPLIDCEISDLKHLVLNNFLNSKGEEISNPTLSTYFNLNKQSEDQAKRDRLDYTEDGFIDRIPINKRLSDKAKKSNPTTYAVPNNYNQID
jgi:hypothetical protein